VSSPSRAKSADKSDGAIWYFIEVSKRKGDIIQYLRRRRAVMKLVRALSLGKEKAEG
jgi:hypothetical protein